MNSIALPGGPFVVVGPPGRGKSTLVGKLVPAGLDPSRVLSLDEMRAEVCPTSPCACRWAQPGCGGRDECGCATPAAAALLEARALDMASRPGAIYFDSTHLKRRSWRVPLMVGEAMGTSTAALLFAPLDLDELLRRNSSRRRQVPPGAVAHLHQLHSQITTESLREVGFDPVHTIDDETEVTP